MFSRLKNFVRNRKREPLTLNPEPLTISGIPPAPLTPEPDDAELAAAALLEEMTAPSNSPEGERKKHGSGLTFGRACSHSEELMRASLFSRLLATFKVKGSGFNSQLSIPNSQFKGSAAYYRSLGDKIRKARTTEAYTAQRYIAYSEQELQKASVMADGGALALIEQGLFKHMDTVEREGGELKTRWQHCLAEVTVKGMEVIKRS